MNSAYNNIEFRYIESVMLNTHATILVADRKNILVMKIKDDSKTIFVNRISVWYKFHLTTKESGQRVSQGFPPGA